MSYFGIKNLNAMEEHAPKNYQETPKTTPEGGTFISLSDAIERTKRFREDYVMRAHDKEEKIKANYFTKDQIMKLLSQPGCEGIRIYNSVHPKVDKDPETGQLIGRREVIIVATNAEGDDLLKKSDYKEGKGCSPFSIFMAMPASRGVQEDALLLGNPDPCPTMCGKRNLLNGN